MSRNRGSRAGRPGDAAVSGHAGCVASERARAAVDVAPVLAAAETTGFTVADGRVRPIFPGHARAKRRGHARRIPERRRADRTEIGIEREDRSRRRSPLRRPEAPRAPRLPEPASAIPRRRAPSVARRHQRPPLVLRSAGEGGGHLQPRPRSDGRRPAPGIGHAGDARCGRRSTPPNGAALPRRRRGHAGLGARLARTVPRRHEPRRSRGIAPVTPPGARACAHQNQLGGRDAAVSRACSIPHGPRRRRWAARARPTGPRCSATG